MNGLALDLRLTARSLLRSRSLLAITLLTIALGVGINTTMYSVLNAVLLRPLPYANPERLVSLWPEKRWGIAMLADVEKRVRSYDAVAMYRGDTYVLIGEETPATVAVSHVSPSYFSLLGATPRLGRAFREGDATNTDGPVVVLSHRLWRQRFNGDRAIVGKSIRLSGGRASARTVVGVMPDGFVPIGPNAEAWVPITRAGQPGSFPGYGASVIGRLKPGVTTPAASAELRRLVPELTPLHPSQFRPIRYSPVDVVGALEVMTRGVRSKLLLLFGAVAFVLLIASTNVANLLLARAHARQAEVAVQLAIGCSRGRVIRQIALEGVLLAVAGGAIGVATAMATMPLVRDLAANYLPRTGTIGIDATVLAYALLVSLGAGMLASALPALRAASVAPGRIMRSSAGRGQSQSRASRRVNDVFVVTQIALSLLLLAGSGLMLKTLWQLSRVELGFSPDNVLSLQLALPQGGRYDTAAARRALLREIDARVAALPGVSAVGATDVLPLSGSSYGLPYRVAGEAQNPSVSQVVNARVVSPSYFGALKVPLMRGRLFTAADAAAPTDSLTPVPIVANEAFARQHWPDGSALGKRIVVGPASAEIIGIVGDARETSIASPADPAIYYSAMQNWSGGYLLVRGTRAMPSRASIAGVLRAVDRNVAVRDVRPMDDVVHAGSNDARFYTRILTLFATLAGLLGIVGVYGVMAYATSRRRREFGVRLAFGSTPGELLSYVLRRALLPVLIGLALGLAGAVALGKVISGFLFGVSPTDPVVLSGVAALLGAAATGAALVPAIRASRVSPVEALRQE